MATRQFSLRLNSPDDTAGFAQSLGRMLRSGDTVLLKGPVGAGKTHFARHLILSILTEPEDIPSPTFTLVQTYDTENGPLWHADLYRIASPLEIEELGLLEAFDSAICLIEWPDRMGGLRPPEALEVALDPTENEQARQLSATWRSALWDTKMQGWGP